MIAYYYWRGALTGLGHDHLDDSLRRLKHAASPRAFLIRAVGPSHAVLLLATLTHMSYLTSRVVRALFCTYLLADQVATLWLYSALSVSDSCPARELYHACLVAVVFVQLFFDTLPHMSYLTQRVVLALHCTYPLADRVSTRLPCDASHFRT